MSSIEPVGNKSFLIKIVQNPICILKRHYSTKRKNLHPKGQLWRPQAHSTKPFIQQIHRLQVWFCISPPPVLHSSEWEFHQDPKLVCMCFILSLDLAEVSKAPSNLAFSLPAFSIAANSFPSTVSWNSGEEPIFARICWLYPF